MNCVWNNDDFFTDINVGLIITRPINDYFHLLTVVKNSGTNELIGYYNCSAFVKHVLILPGARY